MPLKSLVLVLLSAAVSFGVNSKFIEGGDVAIDQTRSLLPVLRQGTDVLIPTYRIESFGKATYSFHMESSLHAKQLSMVVEGPLPGFGDSVAPGAGNIVVSQVARGRVLNVQAHLKVPGVYRVLILNSKEIKGVEVENVLTAHCKGDCYRQNIPQGVFIEGLKKSGALSIVMQKIADRVSGFLSPELLKFFSAEAEGYIMAKDFTKVERFPLLSAAHILANAQEGLAKYEGEPLKKPEIKGGELFALLGDCTIDRKALPPLLDPEFPGIRYGHFSSHTLSNCTIKHSQKFSEILTALAAGNGSFITAFGAQIETPQELLQVLMDHGYYIEMHNMVTYANFISLTASDETYVQWPAWIQVPFATPGSKEGFAVPMSHTHYDWRIFGPGLNVRSSFFLGISGVGFWAETDERPAWTGGYYSRATYTTKRNRREILEAVTLASTYLKRILAERGKMMGDGYGVLGICQDSQAIIEKTLFNTVSNYPLMRWNKFDTEPVVKDTLDPVLSTLPKDSSVNTQDLSDKNYQADVLCRVLKSTPHALDSAFIPDEALRRNLKSIHCH